MVYLNHNDSKLHPTGHSSRGHKSNCWVATAWRRSSPTSRWLPWEPWNPCEESLPKWMGFFNGCWRPPKFGNIRVDFAKMKLDFLIGSAGDLRNNIHRLQHDLLLSNLTIETSNTLWLEISKLVCQDSKTNVTANQHKDCVSSPETLNCLAKCLRAICPKSIAVEAS